MELIENLPVRNRNVNFKKEIVRYLRQWPWFLLSVLLFYIAARIYLRYTQPQYLSKTVLKLNEVKNKNTALGDLKNLGMGVSGSGDLADETAVIASKPILSQVVRNLNLDVAFFSQGKVKEVEQFNESPLYGKIIDRNGNFSTSSYIITPVGKNSYKLSEGPLSESRTFRLGVPAKLPFGTVILDVKPGAEFTKEMKVVFKNPKNAVAELESSVNVAVPENRTMLVDITMTGTVPAKSEAVLNEISKQYNIDANNDKNLEAQSTQDFINKRLDIISNDLSGIESQKEGFKRQNQITDLEAQANLALQNASDNTKAAMNYTAQLDLVNSVYNATSGDQLLPSNMGLSSGIDAAIGKYNELVLTRNRVLKQATTVNPAIIEMNKEIASLKNLIRKNLTESRETLQLQLAQANAQINVAKGNISRYPTQEKIFRSIDRQQTLKEQLYLYLLQKREENAITLEVNAPKAKVVNPAYTIGKVKPNNSQIILGSLAAGFLLPLLFFYAKNTLDTKVHTKQHIISQIPDASIIAEIPVNENENAVVSPNDFSVFAESFRILSSNLKFMLKAREIKSGGVILVTSSVKGEGKTTVSMNTALTLAGKSKTIIVGADIRNPQLHRFVEGKNVGLTDYLVSDLAVPDQFIIKSRINPNLDVLFSGQIAPNPNDLLDMRKFDEMVTYLKSKYEYVVLDSAPVMLVSDTLHLVENSDAILYIVKSDFTEKEMLDFAAGFRKDNHIQNMAFVLNSVKPENTRYGKKYGYGYYNIIENKRKPTIFKKP